MDTNTTQTPTAAFKTEFAVDMSCQSCVDDISNVLKKIPDIKSFDVDLKEQRVVVEGSAAPSKISRALKQSGRSVIIRGQGVANGTHAGAAVCIFDCFNDNPLQLPEVSKQGLARFVQIDNDTCLIDVTVQGLTPGKHGIHIHELGDISQGCDSCGDHYNPTGVDHSDHETGHIGDLGNIEVEGNGWGDLVLESKRVKVWDIIGRSMVITAGEDDLGKGQSSKSKWDGASGAGVLCGIVARSAGAFENVKKVCACSGATLWEEARINERDHK
ncbi:copper chaperone [Umbelopsis nana]